MTPPLPPVPEQGRKWFDTSRGRTRVWDYDDRFWFKVWPRGDCWEWRGGENGVGYGVFKDGLLLGNMQAHRVSFTMAKGTIPPDKIIDHLCNHPWCVKPSHLVLSTQRENTLRGNGIGMRNARKTHCPQGHLYTAENIESHGTGRRCKACRMARWPKARERRRWRVAEARQAERRET